jgi:phage terminase large subunit-like protein
LIVIGRAKKNNKTSDLVFAALFCVTARRSVQGNVALIIANDADQAADDLDLARKLVAVNPELVAEFEVMQRELRLRDGSGGIRILPVGDVSGLHGKSFSFLGVDEIHGYSDWSILEALQPDPTRRDALTWITSYDEISGKPGTPLYDLKTRGFAGTDKRMLFSWYSGDRCTDSDFADLPPEQRANPSMASWPEGRDYLEQQSARLPASMYRRLHLNQGGAESGFVDLNDWDACVDHAARPVINDPGLPVFVGVDASVKRDSTAIVVCSWDHMTQRVRLIAHRVFQPKPDDPLDFETSIEATLYDLTKRFAVQKILYDPFQMAATAQRLSRAGLPIEEFPQTVPNLTAASQNLFELIVGRNLVLYPDAGMRLSVSYAVALETARGWRIAKEKQSHKIDVVVALGMAAYAAVQNQQTPHIVTEELLRQIRAMPRSRHGVGGLFPRSYGWAPPLERRCYPVSAPPASKYLVGGDET